MKRFLGHHVERLIKTLSSELEAMADEPGASDSLHRTRVASRRLEQCLSLFAGYLDPDKVLKLQRRLRKLVKATGSVRNCDIALKLLKTTGVQSRPLTKEIEHQRDARVKDLSAQVKKLRGKGLWKHPARIRVWKRAKGNWDLKETPSANARRILPGLTETWFDAGDRTVLASHDALHPFRLAGKSLRYTLELFTDLYEDRIKQPLEGLRAVQDRLGAVQDCVTTLPLLEGNSRAAAAIRRLQSTREQDFRNYWIRKIAKQRKLWIASLEHTEEYPNGALPSSPRQS